MKCPKCNQTPMSFPHYVFTSKGVGWKEAIQGYLLCEKCGSHLRVRSFGFRFWAFTICFAALLIVEALIINTLVGFIGVTLTSALFIITILATGMIGSLLEWKNFNLDEVQPK